MRQFVTMLTICAGLSLQGCATSTEANLNRRSEAQNAKAPITTAEEAFVEAHADVIGAWNVLSARCSLTLADRPSQRWDKTLRVAHIKILEAIQMRFAIIKTRLNEINESKLLEEAKIKWERDPGPLYHCDSFKSAADTVETALDRSEAALTALELERYPSG